MATITTSSSHARSISLPCRSHPLIEVVEQQLSKFRASSSTSSSSSSLCNRLKSLKDLYESLGSFLELHHNTTQTLSEENNNNKCAIVEQVLDGSLRLLDMCGTTKDVFSQMRESLQELQSSLRRKRGSCSESGDLGNEIIISSYMFSKKKLAKMIKSSKTTTTKKLVINKDSDLFSVVTILNEVEEVTSEVFQSLLAFISGPKTRPSSSSIVSKLFGSRKVSCEGELEANNVELILVNSSNKGIKSVQVKQVLKGLESLEFNIQEFKEELECIFRQLMKTRVSILNIFNN